jgi:hypothetical protein
LIGDPRIYSGEINNQLANYTDFLKNNSGDISKAYQNVIKVKAALGLIGKQSFLGSMVGKHLEVETKIMLAIIGYNQTMINIFKGKNNKPEGQILKLVEDNIQSLLAVYFFGDVGDLNLKKGENRFLSPDFNMDN